MSWWEAAPALLTALLVLLIPGGMVVVAGGGRGLTALALAAPVSIGLSAIAAELSQRAGLGWGFFPVLVVASVVSLFVALGRWLAHRWVPAIIRSEGAWNWNALRWQLLGLGLAVALIGWQITSSIHSPALFSQTFDNVFHLNAVQWVLDSGSASSMTLTAMTAGTNGPSFYPAAWHSAVALVSQMSGVSVPVAINALNLVVASVVWPLGILAITGTMRRLGRTATVMAGAIAASFSAFPILFLDYGVLYPNFLAYALVPGVLVAAVTILKLDVSQSMSSYAGWVFLVIGGLGVALSQPNGIMLTAAVVAPMFFIAAVRSWRSDGALPSTARRGMLIVGAFAMTAAYGMLWEIVRPPAETAGWPIVQTDAQAVGEVVMQAPYGGMSSPVLGALVIVGATTLLRDRKSQVWPVLSWVVIAGLFVVVSSVENSELRNLLTGVWYNNTPRLAAALPVVSAPLAILGLDRCVSWVAAEWGRRNWSARMGVWIGMGALIVLVAALQYPFRGALADLEYIYSTNANSRLISSDELALIERMANEVPEGSVIAVNPWTGGALIYALAGLETTYHHILTGPVPDRDLIDQGLADAEPGDEVCAAVERLGVDFVVDFGTLEVHGASHIFAGFEGLASSGMVELVDAEGDAALYAVVGCTP